LFNLSGAVLQTSAIFDYEFPVDEGDTALNNTYSVRIRTEDDGGNIYEEAMIITVGDVNAAPTNITLDNNDIDEGLAVLTFVGNLDFVDDGEDNPVQETYSIACTTAGVDDAHFQVDNVKLRSSTVFDVNAPDDDDTDNDYEICVRVSDGVNTYDKNFTITVNGTDTAPPTVIAYTPPDNATEVSTILDIEIGFNEPIAK